MRVASYGHTDWEETFASLDYFNSIKAEIHKVLKQLKFLYEMMGIDEERLPLYDALAMSNYYRTDRGFPELREDAAT